MILGGVILFKVEVVKLTDNLTPPFICIFNF